jgi:hypothetical protein
MNEIENTFIVLSETPAGAMWMKKMMDLNDIRIFINHDTLFKTCGLNNLTIFTQLEPDEVDIPLLKECGIKNWTIYFMNEMLDSLKTEYPPHYPSSYNPTP